MPRHRKHSEEGQSSGHGRRRKHSGERRRKHSSDDAAQAEQPSASADALQRPRLSKQLSDSLKRFLPKSGHDARDRRADDFLARLEAAETLDALLDRFTGLEMGSGPHEYAANPSFRGLSTFSVRRTR